MVDENKNELRLDPLPPAVDLIRPSNWLNWIMGFAEGWLFSRESLRLLTGLPFVLASVAGIGYLWWLRHTPENTILADIEKSVSLAINTQDDARVENGLQALVQLRPSEPAYRFRLGQFLISNERPEGLSHILSLAPEKTDGYAPARMWLVKQALSEKPILKLNDQQIEGQLLRIQRQVPEDAESQRLLADLYIRRKEWSLAEKYLTAATRTYPVLSVRLAGVKRILNRDPADITQLLENGVSELQARLAVDRSNHEVRIALAETLAMLGRQAEALTLLDAGYQQSQQPELLTAVCNLQLQQIAQRMRENLLNHEVCLQILLSVIKQQPGHPGILQQLPVIVAAGSVVSADHIQPSLDFWQQAASDSAASDEQRQQASLALAQLLSVAREYQRAIDILQPMVDARPELRLPLAKMLLQSGDTAQAQQLASQLAVERMEALNTDPADETTFAAFLEVRQLLPDPQHMRDEISEWCRTHDKQLLQLRPEIQSAFGNACLLAAKTAQASLEQLAAANDSDASAASDPQTSIKVQAVIDELLHNLTQAATVPATQIAAIDQLAVLRFSDSPAASAASQQLDQLRANGDPNGRVQVILGTRAIMAEKYDQAVTFLERAAIQTRNQQPQILNNLAIALVRSDPPQPERALQYVESAAALLSNNVEIQSTRAEVLVALKRWEEARAELQRVLAQRSSSATIHRLLYTVCNAMNDEAMARIHLERFEELQQR